MPKVGFVETDITPPLGFPIDGSCFAEMHAQRVDDPLFLRVMTLQDDKGARCALVTADLLYFPRDMSWRIKRWAEDTLAMDGAAVILNGSHTHCGPFLHPVYDPDRIDYVESIEWAVRDGIERALRDAVPSEVRYGLLQSHFGINRRRVGPDGQCDPGMLPNENGYYDPDLPVLAVYDAAGEKLNGLWFSYACHPTSRRDAYFSADYPGAIVRHLKAKLGRDVHAHFAQGAGGDVKVRFIDQATNRFRPASWDDVDQLGERVAGEIVEQLTPEHFAPIELDLAFAECEFELPYDMDQVWDEKRLRDQAGGATPPPFGVTLRHGRYWARLMLEAIHMDRLVDHHRMVATKMRLTDDLQLIALSDEVVAEIGRMVKGMFSPGRTIFLGYTNHTEVYVPIARMLAEGGYESVRSVQYALQHNLQPAPFSSDVDTVIRHAVMSLDA